MAKISKKDQTNESIAAEAAATFALAEKRSHHFDVGTQVVINNERATVLARSGEGMLVCYEDETTQILRPYALQWEENRG